ncbi:MAG: hypothetical protein AAGL98_08455, partial [Planctomycetota bacterium]
MKYPFLLVTPRCALAVSVAVVAVWLAASTPARAADLTLGLTLDNGDVVNVRQIGRPVTTARLEYLLRQADRSTVKTDTSGPADGTMTAGDHVAITNDLLVWFD